MADGPRPLVIDADGHITAPRMVWSDYTEPPYRERTPQRTLDEQGTSVVLVNDRVRRA